MATLPIQQQRTNLLGSSLGPGPSDRQGVPALGSALKSVGDSVELVNRQDDATDLAAALSDLRLTAAKRFVDAQSSAKPGAENFTPDLLSTFDTDLSGAADKGRSPRSKRLIKIAGSELRNDLGARAIGWEAQQRTDYRKNAALESADKLRSVLELDPSQWRDAGTEQMAAVNALAIPPSEKLELARHIDASLTEGAAIGLAKQNPQSALAALKTTKSGDARFDGLTSTARDRVEAFAHAQLIQQTVGRVMNAYESGGVDSGLQTTHDVLADKSLSDDQKLEIRSKINADLSQLRAQRKEEHAADLTTIDRALAADTAGNGTHTSIDSLYQSGALSASEQASLHGRVDDSMLRAAAAGASAATFNAAMAQGLPLDPKDAEQRKAYTAAFSQDVVGQQPGTPAWQAAAQAWTQRTRMLPPPAVSWLRAALRSQSPQLAANAASFLGATQAATPDAVGEIDADTRSLGGIINSMTEAGTPPAEAVTTARALVLDASPQMIEKRKHAWSGAGRDSLLNGSPAALSTFIDRDFDPSIWTAQPDAVDPRQARAVGAKLLQNDFDQQTERYFLRTGDVNVARDLAWQDVTRVYGPSKVNGTNAMMAFPPERFGVTPDEVKTDVSAFLEANPQSDGTTAADAVVVPDSLTMRAAADALNGEPIRPSYAVVGKTGDVLTDSRGVPIRYTIPSGEVLTQRLRDAQAKAAEIARAGIEKARAARAAKEAARKAFAEQVRSGVMPTSQD